ncbi:hypothetical protein FD755_024273, partial [Muntiacus reevesi]
EAESGIVRRESTTFSENNNSDSEIEDVLETFPKPSPGVQGFPHPAFPRPDPLPKPLKTLAGLGLAKVSCVVFNSCFPLYFSTHHSLDPYDDKKDSTVEMEGFNVMIQNDVIIRAIYLHDSDL